MNQPLRGASVLFAQNEHSATAQPLDVQLAAERTRLLYQGSQVPTLFMLLCGLFVSVLLWQANPSWMLLGWLSCLVVLAVLRLVQVASFKRALPSQQAQPYWRRIFLLGAIASGLTLAYASIFLAPIDNFQLQGLIYCMVVASSFSASVAYAVSRLAFFSFVLPCLLPAVGYLLLHEQPILRTWGWLGLIMLVSLCLVALQINLLLQRSLTRRLQNQALIHSLEESHRRTEGLNTELAREVEQRRRAERELRHAHDELSVRVDQRTRELDDTSLALNASEARLALALEASELGLWDWDLQTDQVHHTNLERIFGISQSEVTGVLKDLKPRLHPDDLPVLRRALVEHLKGSSQSYNVEYRVRHGDGRWLWVEDRGRAVLRDQHNKVTRMIGTRRDITGRKRREEQQRLSATVFEACSEGIMILDASYCVLSVNQAFSEVTGYRRDEVTGLSVGKLLSSEDTRRKYQLIRHELEHTGSWRGELLETRKNGELYPQWLQINVVRDTRGQVSHIVGFFSDLSQRRQTEERLRYLSQHDELTGLANRSLLRERVHEACQKARQDESYQMALLHVDLDRFKQLNDSLGHELADQLLRQMARRLNQSLPDANTVARLAGDEFAILLDGYGSLAALSRAASRTLTRIRAPMELGGHELMVSASMGISLLPENAREGAALLSQADMAKQHAKHLGGNTFQFYTDNLQACTLERLQMETQLRRGIEDGQLEVYYQPKLSLPDGGLNSAEALVRWQHPKLGLVSPSDFIPLAEETGLISAIGEQVLRKACTQAREWQRQGLADIRVSVNLSVHQLRQGNLVGLVQQVLTETGLAARLLELELTESHMLDNVGNVIETFQQLREIGVKLAIDDFGTGYSSLSYLKRFPVDYVKIDQTFIRDVDSNHEDAAITRAVISMAHGLGLQVVAEGVEADGQMEFLKAHRCDEIQGYLVSRPLPAADFAELLRRQPVLA